MLELLLVGMAVLALLILAMTSTRSVDGMTRENPGVRDRAEWIAPPDVMEAVKGDYLAFYDYAAVRLRQGWVAYGRDLNEHLTGDLLSFQRESIAQRLQTDRGCIVDVLRADHDVQVRHFSTDGMRCIIIDHQTDQRLATYDYWAGHRLHTQDMGAGIFVYEMAFDLRANKWKLARFVQCLPPGTQQPGELALNLPQPAGRDQ